MHIDCQTLESITSLFKEPSTLDFVKINIVKHFSSWLSKTKADLIKGCGLTKLDENMSPSKVTLTCDSIILYSMFTMKNVDLYDNL